MTLSKLNLKITGKPMADPLPTGMPSIAAGAVTQEPSIALKVVAKLVKNEPQETDRKLLSLMISHGISMTDESEMRFPKDGEPYTVKHGYSVKLHENGCDFVGAIRDVSLAMTPMAQEDMIKSLAAVMMLMVKPAGETSKDASMRCKLYANQMHDWPADIFVKVLDIISKTMTFWPAFAEFNKHYERLVIDRKNMLKDLHKCREMT